VVYQDWHIVTASKSTKYLPYKTPKYFSSDWLNETCEGTADDFKFAYMGPKGSWTPFHSDVYGSYSWSANVFGRKKWRLYPPGKEMRFFQPKSGSLQHTFENSGVENEDFVDIIQEQGEIIFVPSGWHHIVWNETDTISINHNWFNACNVCHVWSQLRKAFEDVQCELADLRDIDDYFEQCQIVLKANHGMDYKMFVDLLLKVVRNRRTGDTMKSHEESSDDVPESGDLRKFDAQAVAHVFAHLQEDKEMSRFILW
jgi:ribosomal protein L16 Arg81 hydroxylase